MSIARLRVLAIAVALAGSGVLISLLHAQTPPEWKVGDVFVAIGGGKYEVWANSGGTTPKQTIQIANTDETAGCWFDSQFNLYTADFDNTRVIRHQLAVPHNQDVFANTNAEANNGHSQSIVMAVNGDVFVGNAGGGTQVKSILRYRSDGVFLQKYLPATDGGGINWMDLATDQRTMFYTSLGRKIKRFNVAGTGGPLSDFATLPGSGNSNVAHAIRLLPPFDANASGGLLVADKAVIRKVNGSGASTYDAAGEDNWQSLNLDPDGLTFWAGGFTTGKLYRFNIASGDQVGSAIQTAGANALMGLCVMGEAQLQIRPLQLSTAPSTPALKDVTAPFGDPASENVNTAFYSFSTWRLRINVKGGQNIVAAVSFTPATTDKTCTTTDPNDFDCRFQEASLTAATQCVPFFQDPSAPVGSGTLGRYRCGYYRVKDMPTCQQSNPVGCPFNEQFVGGTGQGSDDILSEILMNLTNPPEGVFSVAPYGPVPKGNPRLMRDPDSVTTGPFGGNQFFIDATTAVIDWPAFGTGTPNDYSPVMRMTTTAGGAGCADIIKPDNVGQNAGSSMKVIIEVKDGIRDPISGLCTGNPISNAVADGNNVTLAISNPNTNPPVLVIYCETPGSSLGCFTPVNGQDGRYQSTLDLTNPPFIPSNQHPYFLAVTSVNIPTANPGTQNSGQFPPVGRSYFMCTNGSNCGG